MNLRRRITRLVQDSLHCFGGTTSRTLIAKQTKNKHFVTPHLRRDARFGTTIPNRYAKLTPSDVSSIRSLKRCSILAAVASPYSSTQKTKKVVKADVIYQRLACVAAAAMNAPAETAAIIIGCKLCVSNQETVSAPANTETTRPTLRNFCTSLLGRMTNNDAPTIQPICSIPSAKPAAVAVAAARPSSMP